MKRFTVLWIVVLGLGVASNASAGHNPTYLFSGGDIGCEGTRLEITITLLNADAATAFGFGVCHDSEFLSVAVNDDDDPEIVLGDGLSPDDFSFEGINVVDDEGWNAGVSMSPGASIDGDEIEVYVATYRLDSEIEDGTDLEFCEIGDPGVLVFVNDPDDPLDADDTHTIVIEPSSPYEFHLSCATLTYSPETGEVRGDYTPTITITEVQPDDDDPRESSGFQVGLAHDDDVLDVNLSTRVGVLAAVNDGDGPSFIGENLNPGNGPGWTLGIVYKLTGGQDIDFSDGDGTDPCEDPDGDAVLQCSYTVIADLEGNEDGLETTVEWTDVLGSVALPNSLVVGNTSPLVCKVDGTLTLKPVSAVFLRGDSDGDGSVHTLLDPVYSLAWAFQAGPDPPCMAAADSDGDGAVNTLLDPTYSLKWAFQGGPDPPDPGPYECGTDPEGAQPGCQTPPDCSD